jgi:hypothetical protein
VLGPLERDNLIHLTTANVKIYFTLLASYAMIILILIYYCFNRPPLRSNGQSSWLQIQRSWVRFPALPDFLRSSGSGTGSTQPREDNAV